MKSDFFGETIFSDDLRHEIGGKVSYIGVYNGIINFHGQHFPIIIPKLSLAINIYMPIEVEPGEIEVLVYFPGDVDGSPTYRETVKKTAPRQMVVPGAPLSDLRGTFKKLLMFSPVELKSEGKISVRVKIGDEIVKAGSLYVRGLPQPAKA